MAGRFPGAATVDALWKNLCDGVDCLHVSTDEELKEAGLADWQKKHRDFVRVGGVIEGAGEFDASFFGFSAHDASIIDPQHRVFMECAWEAFEDAGYDPLKNGEGVGVFTGAGTNTYRKQDLGPTVDTATTLQLMVGGEKDFLATRVAYKLNLTGPAITVQTACSTSLVAVQMAYESLRSGTSRMAIAGGVSIMFPQATGYIYQPGMILSPDGYCRAFDAKAGGTSFGRGAGAVLLKPLDAAIRDRDHIYAVIHGAAINNDGAAKGGYTAPGVKGQAEVIRRAMQMAAFDPETVRFVEAHGTGTEIGDSIEIAALAEAFSGSELQSESCTVGALKANIGHLDAAAGVAALIKTVKTLQERVLPGTMHFERANPELRLEQTPFRITSKLARYDGREPMRAGVSAFGIGGTNAHVCLEEWIEETPATAGNGHRRQASAAPQLFPLSANSEAALAAQRLRLAEHLEAHAELGIDDVAYTLQVGRRLFAHRYFAVASSREELIAALRSPEMAKGHSNVTTAQDPEIFFLFPGQGAQYVNMGRGLYESDRLFHEVIDQCAEILKPLIKADLREILFPEPGGEETATALLKQTRITQPALFSLEYALAMRLLASGVKPTAMLGHSLGEYVAATIAGVFRIEHILEIVARRGAQVQTIPSGSMLAVSLGEEALMTLLPEGLSIAAVNAPKQTIVSGPTPAIEAFAADLNKQRIACAALVTSHAFHSAMLDPIVGFTASTVAQFPRGVPKIPLISNLTGTWITDEQATDPWYYDAHLRQAVRFADGLRLLTEKSSGVIVEVGPGETLLPLARSATKGMKGFRLVSTTRRASATSTDEEFWLQSMGQLWLAGVKLDWQAIHGERRPHRVSLPTYPFERQYYWIDDAWGRPSHKSGRAEQGPMYKRDDIADWFYTRSWRSVPTPPADEGKLAHTRWALFADVGDGTVSKLESLLRQSAALVMSVAPGENFAEVTKTQFTMDFDKPADYEALMAAWTRNEAWPEHIVWSIRREDTSQPPQQAYLRLFHFAQALQQSGQTESLKLHVLTEGAFDVLGTGDSAAGLTAAASLAEVMGLELPGLTTNVIDYGGASDASAMLLKELTGGDSKELVAYRGRTRWVPEWIGLKPSSGAKLRRGAAYILTGGVGGIGLVLAEHLAATSGAHLILVSRSPLPPADRWEAVAHDATAEALLREKARSLLRILGAGGTVEVRQADVTDAAKMREIVAAAAGFEGGLGGIIHAAGVSDFTVIGATEIEAVERIFAAKAEGTGWIAEAIAQHKMDFVMLCSSMSAIVPSVGLSAYGAANAYLDGFAARHDDPEGTRVFSVNWDRWSETGMAYQAAAITQSAAGAEPAIEFGISNEEAVRVFDRVLSSPVSQVAVSARDLHRWVESVRTPSTVNDTSAGDAVLHPRPELSHAYTAPETEAERAVVEIWQELLGIEQVGIHDDFFELGGHSLLGAQFIARIRERFQVDIPLRTIFETPTPAACAQLVSAKVPEAALDSSLNVDRERVEIEI
jgi:acyl transferase domain-containing protein